MELEKLFQNAKRVVICGIGNDIRGDDAFGVLVAKRLKELIKKENVLVLNCGEVPENYTGRIAEFKPDLVVFIDAADFNARFAIEIHHPVHENDDQRGFCPDGLSALFNRSLPGIKRTHKEARGEVGGAARGNSGKKILKGRT